MEREIEEKFSELQKKIEDQFRFTRNVLVLCTMAIIGVLIFTFTTTIESLPTRILFHCMSNLDSVVLEWKSCESVLANRREANLESKRQSQNGTNDNPKQE